MKQKTKAPIRPQHQENGKRELLCCILFRLKLQLQQLHLKICWYTNYCYLENQQNIHVAVLKTSCRQMHPFCYGKIPKLMFLLGMVIISHRLFHICVISCKHSSCDWTHTHKHAHTHTHTRTRTHTCTCTRTHMRTRMCTHTRAHTRARARTHTHTQYF